MKNKLVISKSYLKDTCEELPDLECWHVEDVGETEGTGRVATVTVTFPATKPNTWSLQVHPEPIMGALVHGAMLGAGGNGRGREDYFGVPQEWETKNACCTLPVVCLVFFPQDQNEGINTRALQLIPHYNKFCIRDNLI